MTGIEGRTVFARPPEEVFDFLADPRNEPAYHPIVLSADNKLTLRPDRTADPLRAEGQAIREGR